MFLTNFDVYFVFGYARFTVRALESIRANPRGLRVPAFTGRVRVVLGAGARRARDKKFFVRVTEG